MDTSKTYCNEAWRTVHFDEAGMLAPCCTFRGDRNTAFNNFTHYWNSEWLADVRNKMILGENIPGCKQCYIKEARGERSQRIEKNELHGVIFEPEIQEIHMSFGNTCNKSCNICRPQRSQLIAKEYKQFDPNNDFMQDKMQNRGVQLAVDGKIGKLYWEKIDNYVEALSSAEKIVFDGGEPTITKQFDMCLDYMIDNGLTNKKLSVSTNGSVTREQLEKLSKFKFVAFHLSIDGVDDLYELVRSPHDWDWWCKQHALIREYDIEVTFACVAHVFNVHNLRDCLDYFMSEHGNFYFSTLNGHKHLGVDLVPDGIIDCAISDLRRADYHYTERQASNLMNLIEHLHYMKKVNNPENRHLFRTFLPEQQRIKGLDFQKYIPWDLNNV